MLYLRKTVHMFIDSTVIVNQTENNYQVTTDESNGAGSSPSSGLNAADYSNITITMNNLVYSAEVRIDK